MGRKKKVFSDAENMVAEKIELSVDKASNDDSNPENLIPSNSGELEKLTKAIYNGCNVREIMDFCGAYHVQIEQNVTKFLIDLGGKNGDFILPVKLNQMVIKESGIFKAIDNV